MYQPSFVNQPVNTSNKNNNIVITNQPMSQPAMMQPRLWSSGLCDCCDDIPICLCTMFCYTCMAMKVASDMDEFVCLPCCVPAATLILRVKMRAQERIPGSICNDCLTDCWCASCSLCQLAREVKRVKAQQTYAMTNQRRY